MFDTHCHLTDKAYSEDLEDVLLRARDVGINGIVTIASNADDAVSAEALAAGRDAVWWTAGLHPHEADRAEADLPRIREMLGHDGVVAVGETGLDYYYDNAPREAQRRSFDRHLGFAAETGLPIVVHSRSADDDTAAAVRAAKGVTGVLHCFSGGVDLLECGIEAGWYFSFGGMVTFRKWDGADLLRRVPPDRLLLETDGPYLTPVPYRGRRNEPAFMVHARDAAADVLEVEHAQLGIRTEANARRFYGLSTPARAVADPPAG
jgi:TatD DNase family protein